MRHRVYGKHLGRNKNERSTLFRSLVQSLFTYGTIETSETKAKAVKGLVDRVINLAKEKRTQPQIQSFLIDKNLRERLIKEIVPKLTSRTSGYTSVIKMGTRLGDQTMMVKMSLIGSEELKPLVQVASNKSQVTSKKSEVKKVTSEKKARTGRSVRITKSKVRRSSRSSK